jgi:hypothetical protein
MINIICRRIGVNGFIDYEGKGFIHESEPTQAIFFKVKNLGQIFTYETKDPKLRQLNDDEIVDSYDTKYIYLKNGLYAVKVPNGGTSYYIITDKNGRLFIKQRFIDVEAYKNKLILVMDAYQKINFINNKKEYILDNFARFQPKISYDSDGNLVMTDNDTNTVYVVDEDGNLINKYTEESQKSFSDEQIPEFERFIELYDNLQAHAWDSNLLYSKLTNQYVELVGKKRLEDYLIKYLSDNKRNDIIKFINQRWKYQKNL